MQVVRRLGSLQYDPIAIAGRSHDLVLHARVADYDPAWCEELYDKREIVEAYNKGLSFVPVDEFPWFRGVLSRRPADEIAAHQDVADAVLERIRTEGPLSVHDFERQSGTSTDWFGLPTNAVRAVLEAYSTLSVLGLVRREGSRRYYDLIERLLPKKVLAKEIPLREQLLHKMLSRYRAHGLLGASAQFDIFQGLGAAKPTGKYAHHPGRVSMQQELVDRGDLVPVEIEGLRGKRFVVKEEVGLLESPREPPPSVAFLSPFDPLVWERTFLKALFGFEYVWELFHPPEKRRWGWYVLPIVFRDRFVGRIEPRIDNDKVEVLNVWWEDGFAPRRTDGFVDAYRDALAAYLRFARATKLQWASHLPRTERLSA